MKIPSTMRDKVWNTYIGSDLKIGACFIGCGETILKRKFECGHITAKSRGGETILQNLRPICSRCNRSIGNKNMFEFIEKYRYKRNSDDFAIDEIKFICLNINSLD